MRFFAYLKRYAHGLVPVVPLRRQRAFRFGLAAGLAGFVAVVPASSMEGAGQAGSESAQLTDPLINPPSLDDFEVQPDGDSDGVLPEAPPEEGAASVHSTQLDELFLELRDADDPRQASGISVRIQRLLIISGSPTVDLLMLRAGEAIKAKQYALALDLLDAVLRLKPEFAEGWNRRATVHYLREDFGRAIADIEQVLVLEPRHFPAISGLGMILRRIGRPEQALRVFQEVLLINPMQESAQEAIKSIRGETVIEGI